MRDIDVSRVLDLAALRSFVAVADRGGITRAAAAVNLTQSAVSMQIRRLEEALGLALLDRRGRGVVPTAAGEQLLGYARRLLALNDEALGRLTHQAYEGAVVLGVPHDIVYPALPAVLQRFAAAYPRVKVQLLSSYTVRLQSLFARGEADLILTTEDGTPAGAEGLTELQLVWVGAPGGSAWRARPLRMAFEHGCIFRARAERALDAAGIAWEMAVESDSSRTIEASVSADLAVHALVAPTVPPQLEVIRHGGALPELGHTCVNLYCRAGADAPAVTALGTLLREAFRGGGPVQRAGEGAIRA